MIPQRAVRIRCAILGVVLIQSGFCAAQQYVQSRVDGASPATSDIYDSANIGSEFGPVSLARPAVGDRNGAPRFTSSAAPESRSLVPRSLLAATPGIVGIETPGTNDYPNGGMRVVSELGRHCFTECAYADLVNRYLYVGTSGHYESMCFKVRLGAPGAVPKLLGYTLTSQDDGYLWSVVADQARGYLYFGTGNGYIVKVAMGAGDAPPRKVASVSSGFQYLQAAMIDPDAGYAWFGSLNPSSPGGLVKVALGDGDSTPTIVGTMSTGYPMCRALRDPATNIGYFGTATHPGRLLKYDLRSGTDMPTLIGSVSFAAGEDDVISGFLDPSTNRGYFGTDTMPGYVVKVDLGGPTSAPMRLNSLAFDPSESSLPTAVADLAEGYACFGTFTTPGRVVKVALGDADSTPTKLGTITFASPNNYVTSMDMDPASNYLWCGTNNVGGSLSMLEVSGTTPTLAAQVTLPALYVYLQGLDIDPINHRLYGAHFTSPGAVTKMDTGAGAGKPVYLGAGSAASGENSFSAMVVDSVRGYGYCTNRPMSIGTRFVKFALGAGDTPPSRVAGISLSATPFGVSTRCAALDAANGHIYAGYADWYGYSRTAAKFDVGAGDAAPSLLGSGNLSGGSGDPMIPVGLAIDPVTRTAYTGGGTNVEFFKFNLGTGTNPPTLAGTITIAAGDGKPTAMLVDAVNRKLYVAGSNLPSAGMLVRYGLTSGLPVREASLPVTLQELSPVSLLLDSSTGDLYVGTYVNCIKVHVGNGTSPMTRIGSVPTVNLSCNSAVAAALDEAEGFAYFGGSSWPSNINKVALSQKGMIKATRTTVTATLSPVGVGLYSHVAGGNVRLAVYSDGASMTRVWESGPVANGASNSWLYVPVSSGTPSTLTLTPGVYWLAWQTDSKLFGPSFVQGSQGDGFFYGQAFGSFPSEILSEDATFTDEMWAQYATDGPVADVADWNAY